jgi:hypothetical protein
VRKKYFAVKFCIFEYCALLIIIIIMFILVDQLEVLVLISYSFSFVALFNEKLKEIHCVVSDDIYLVILSELDMKTRNFELTYASTYYAVFIVHEIIFTKQSIYCFRKTTHSSMTTALIGN